MADAAERVLNLSAAQRDQISQDRWENLRLDLTIQREQALSLIDRGTLQGRIAKAQLSELDGAVPRGQSEPAWIKAKRAALNDTLSSEDDPASAARDLAARDGVLIHEIDQILRQRRRQQLFEHDYPILRGATWTAAARDLQNGESSVPLLTVVPRIATSVGGIPLAFRLAAILIVGLAGAWLAARCRAALTRAIRRPDDPAASPRRLGVAFARDLLDIAAPTIVLLLLLAAIRLLTDDLPILSPFSGQIILAGLTVIFARWMGRSLFAPAFPPAQLLLLPAGDAPKAVRLMTLLGLALGADQLLDYASRQPANSVALNAILSFVIAVAMSVLMWRLARRLHQARGARSAAADPAPARDDADRPTNAVRPTAQLMAAAAAVALLAALSGYVALARYLLTATIGSLAVVGTALFLYRSLTEAGALLFGYDKPGGSRYLQLLPLAFGFLLSVVTLPLLGIMWGLSAEQVVDGIIALKDGVAVGQIRVSFGSVMTFALVFLLGYALTRWMQRVLHYAVLDRLHIEAGARAAVLTGFGYIGLTLSALVSITAAGLDLSSLAFVAGALSVGVGFGLQSVVANFVSGIILLIERPIKVGDWIEVGAFSGHVRKIAFRSTHIETFDRHEVIVPNSELIAGSVTNLTYGDSLGRITLPIGVAYGSDLEAAKTVLLAAMGGHAHVLHKPEPSVVIDGLGDSAVNLKALCFVNNVNQRQTVRSDLYFAILKAMQDAGIAIPFPQRDLWIHADDGPDRRQPSDGSRPSASAEGGPGAGSGR